MRPGPKKPGESAAEYNARVKAMEQKWMSGMGRPKGGGTQGASKPIGGGGAPSGMSPIPPKPRTPVKPTVTTPRPISPKGDGGSRPRGTSPAPGYGGGKPKVSMTPIRDGRGPRGLKSGGMVKGKK